LNAEDTDLADLRGFFFNALIRENPDGRSRVIRVIRVQKKELPN
jgi:hypothetical protein